MGTQVPFESDNMSLLYLKKVNKMTNEVITNEEAGDLLNQADSIETGELTKLGQSDWIPLMAVAHFLSDSVATGKARPGEFFLGGQTSLGEKITVIPLAFRLHVALINTDNNEFVENQYAMMGQPSSEEYKALVAMRLSPPVGHTVSEGADLFLYLPGSNSFAQFFMKGELAKDIDTVWRTGKGGKAVEIKTVLNKAKRGSNKWFRLNVVPTQHSLKIAKTGLQDIDMDVDQYTKFLKQFSNPVKATTETVSGSTEETIER